MSKAQKFVLSGAVFALAGSILLDAYGQSITGVMLICAGIFMVFLGPLLADI